MLLLVLLYGADYPAILLLVLLYEADCPWGAIRGGSLKGTFIPHNILSFLFAYSAAGVAATYAHGMWETKLGWVCPAPGRETSSEL